MLILSPLNVKEMDANHDMQTFGEKDEQCGKICKINSTQTFKLIHCI
jgi:hypothetical protein